MNLSEIQEQALFLYDLKWNVEIDTKLLDIMLKHKEECHPTLAHKSPHVHVEAVTILNQTSSRPLTLMDVEERAEFLAGHFSCFKRIMSMPETHWDQQANCIIASKDVLVKIIKENNFSAAYYYHGEPQHLKMFNLFDTATIKTEPSHTVIIISDSVPEQGKLVNVDYDISSDDDVSSPPLVEATRVRKKLFHDDNDAHSTAQAEDNSPPRTGWKYPARNAFPTRPKDFGGVSKEAEGSSCASCSPFK